MPYLDVKSIVYSDTYKRALQQYISLEKNIRATEGKIIAWPVFSKKLHEPIIAGKYAGQLHARVTENIRIMYTYDRKTKTIYFMDIVTKNDLEKS